MAVRKAMGRVLIPFDKDAKNFIDAGGLDKDSNLNVEGLYTAEQARYAVNYLVNGLKNINVWNKVRLFYPIIGGTLNTIKTNLISPSYGTLEEQWSKASKYINSKGFYDVVYTTNYFLDFSPTASYTMGGFVDSMINSEQSPDTRFICGRNNTNNKISNPSLIDNPNQYGMSSFVSNSMVGGHGNGGVTNFYKPVSSFDLYKGFICFSSNRNTVSNYQGDTQYGSALTITNNSLTHITIGGGGTQFTSSLGVYYSPVLANSYFISELLTLDESYLMQKVVAGFNSIQYRNPFYP